MKHKQILLPEIVNGVFIHNRIVHSNNTRTNNNNMYVPSSCKSRLSQQI